MSFDLRPATLEKALGNMTIANLQPMMEVLSVPEPQPTRKPAIIAAVRLRLTEDVLRTIWRYLDETQQLAVSETLYSPEHRFHPQHFYAVYGALPEGINKNYVREFSPLHFFLYPPFSYRDLPIVIPKELKPQLVKFVPRPPKPAINSLDEVPDFLDRRRRTHGSEKPEFDRVPMIRRGMEPVAVPDLFAVLHLIDGGKIAVSVKTRRPTAVSVRRIAEVLYGGDFFDPTAKKRQGQMIGPIRAFAWPWMVQAAQLAELRGSKLALTKAGRTAFAAPPEKTLRRLWERWLKSTLLDEFSRVDAIKGQFRGRGRQMLTSPRKRRPVVAEALAKCPVGGWVQVDGLFRFMHATGLGFGVTRDPRSLYLVDPEYGSLGHAAGLLWNFVEGRYARCLLFEYAATLGMVDVAFTDPRGARLDYTHLWGADELDFLSRYDGLEYVRLNPLGAYCLGQTQAYEPTTPTIRTALTLRTDLRVHAAAPLTPQERLLLEAYAQAESDGVWRLDLLRALTAAESGQDVGRLRTFLAARDDQPLPERVEGFLRSVERGASALTPKGRAWLIECRDRKVADRIVADRRAAKLCLRAGLRHLVVHAGSEAAFRRVARALGYALSLR